MELVLVIFRRFIQKCFLWSSWFFFVESKIALIKYKHYSNLEARLVESAKNFDDELKFVTNMILMPTNWTCNCRFSLQISQLMISTLFTRTISSSEVFVVCSMCIGCPNPCRAGHKCSERGFIQCSASSKIVLESYYQTELLHVHKNRTDNLSLKDIATEYVNGSSHRQTIFYTYWLTYVTVKARAWGF